MVERLPKDPFSFKCDYSVSSDLAYFFTPYYCNDNDDEKKMMLDCTTERNIRPAIKTKQQTVF